MATGTPMRTASARGARPSPGRRPTGRAPGREGPARNPPTPDPLPGEPSRPRAAGPAAERNTPRRSGDACDCAVDVRCWMGSRVATVADGPGCRRRGQARDRPGGGVEEIVLAGQSLLHPGLALDAV